MAISKKEIIILMLFIIVNNLFSQIISSWSNDRIQQTSCWLEMEKEKYIIYHDINLPDKFKNAIHSAIKHVEPKSNIGQGYELEYSEQAKSYGFNNGDCEIIYKEYPPTDFDPSPAHAKCINKSNGAFESRGIDSKPNYDKYVGSVEEFDVVLNIYYNDLPDGYPGKLIWTDDPVYFNKDGYLNIEHSLRHEVGHAIGLSHSKYSDLMRDGIKGNPPRIINQNDKDNMYAIINPPDFIKPDKESICLLKNISNYEVNDYKYEFKIGKIEGIVSDVEDMKYVILDEDKKYIEEINNKICSYDYLEFKDGWFKYKLNISDIPYESFYFRAQLLGFNFKDDSVFKNNILKIPGAEVKINIYDFNISSPLPNQYSDGKDKLVLNVNAIQKGADGTLSLPKEFITGDFVETVKKVKYEIWEQ